MNNSPTGSISNKTNMISNHKKTTVLTVTIIGSLVFPLILSFSIMMAGDITRSVLVFAQQNDTETGTDNDLQKQNGPVDETFNNNNEEEKNAVGTVTDDIATTPPSSPPIENCGINPNAPPCCTPGQDEGCTNASVDEVTISNFNTIPQKINSQDEFKVQVTVTNNLNIPITYRGDMCGGSPLDIQFDKNVNVYNAIACQAISTETLNASESTTVEGKGYEILRAMGSGNVNTKITFNYELQNDDTQEKQVTKSFSFNIE